MSANGADVRLLQRAKRILPIRTNSFNPPPTPFSHYALSDHVPCLFSYVIYYVYRSLLYGIPSCYIINKMIHFKRKTLYYI